MAVRSVVGITAYAQKNLRLHNVCWIWHSSPSLHVQSTILDLNEYHSICVIATDDFGVHLVIHKTSLHWACCLSVLVLSLCLSKLLIPWPSPSVCSLDFYFCVSIDPPWSVTDPTAGTKHDSIKEVDILANLLRLVLSTCMPWKPPEVQEKGSCILESLQKLLEDRSKADMITARYNE